MLATRLVLLMGKDLLLVTLGRSKNQTFDVLQKLRDGHEDEEEEEPV